VTSRETGFVHGRQLVARRTSSGAGLAHHGQLKLVKFELPTPESVVTVIVYVPIALALPPIRPVGGSM